MADHEVVATMVGWVCVRTPERDAWWMQPSEYALRFPAREQPLPDAVDLFARAIAMRLPEDGTPDRLAHVLRMAIEHDYFRAHETGGLDKIEPKGGTGPAWRFRSIEESAEARAFVDEQRDAAQIDPNDTPARRAVGRLLTALHLYSGYEIRSRGPLGCIMDAINEIAPDIAERLRNDEDPGDLMHEIEGSL